MTNPTRTHITGTLTFQSEQDGREITVPFRSFAATTETPYVDLVDEAIERTSLPELPGEYEWLQLDETIHETRIQRGGN